MFSSLPSLTQFAPSSINNSTRAKSPEHKLRIMGAGPCRATAIVNGAEFQCTCQQGVFKIQSLSNANDDEKCGKCTHPLSEHEDFTTAAFTVQGPAVHSSKHIESYSK